MRSVGAFTAITVLLATCGCGGGNGSSSGSGSAIVINVTPAKADVDAGGTVVVDYTYSGDPNYGGLTTTLSGAGSITTTGPDFFGQYSARYTAPGSPYLVNSPSLVGTTASITIASRTNSSKNVVVPITLHDNIQFPAQTPPGANATKAYTYTFTASGGTGTLSFTLVNGSTPLPPGLTLSTAGVLSGTPTTIGTYTFQVVVLDQEATMVGIARSFTVQVS